MCCLKRPFDDQSQPRIRLESEAVLALMEDASGEVLFVHSMAHDLENAQNPVASRATRVRQWLETWPITECDDATLIARTDVLMALGFKNFDALHLACAEIATGEVLATCDDRFQAAARRNQNVLMIRVINPVDLLREVRP